MVDIFGCLTDGAALHTLVQRAELAQMNLYADGAAAALALVDDPQAARVLPRFGRRLQTTTVQSHAWPRGRQVTIWGIDYPFPHFYVQLRTRLAAVLTTTRIDAGTLEQTLSAEAAAATWTQCWRLAYGESSPDAAAAAAHAAAIVHSFGGLPWHRTATGIARILPEQPFRHIPRGAAAQPPTMQSTHGVSSHCIGWAVIPAGTLSNEEAQDTLVYLAGVGQQKKLRAIWAALLASKRDVIKLPAPIERYGRIEFDARPARRPAGTQVLKTYWNDAPLPESGLAHMAMIHWSIHAPRALEPFIHLTGEDGIPDLARFMAQLEAASPLPLQPAWAAQLWELGIARTRIVPLPSYGCAAFHVDPSDTVAWGHIVARCLGHPHATFRRVGSPVTTEDGDLAVPVDEPIAASVD